MTVSTQPYKQYKDIAAPKAYPGRPLLMLYDGVIKTLEKAQKAIREKNFNQAHLQIIIAQDIILELMSILNMECEASRKLFDFYQHIHGKLADANIKKDLDLLKELHALMIEARNTWGEASGEKDTVSLTKTG